MKSRTADQELPASTRIVMICGLPGSGKTSFALTFQKPLLISFELGASRALRRAPLTLFPESWKDITDLARDISQGKYNDYDSVILDSLSRLQSGLIEKTIGDRHGNDMRAHYADVYEKTMLLPNAIKASALDLIVLLHMERNIEQGAGSQVVEQVQLVGKSRHILTAEADIIGYMDTRQSEKDESDLVVFDCSPRFSPSKNPHKIIPAQGRDFSMAVNPDDPETGKRLMDALSDKIGQRKMKPPPRPEGMPSNAYYPILTEPLDVLMALLTAPVRLSIEMAKDIGTAQVARQTINNAKLPVLDKNRAKHCLIATCAAKGIYFDPAKDGRFFTVEQDPA